MTELAALPTVEWRTATEAERGRILTRGQGTGGFGADAMLRSAVIRMVEDVRSRGDQALLDALRRFDGIELSGAGHLRVSDAEFAEARAGVSPALLEAIRHLITQARTFNEELLARAGSWAVSPRPGVLHGEQVAPIPSVGLFVPSGKGSYPSVLIQIATPAVVAGVDRIVVMVPPLPGGDGRVDSATLAAAAELGLREVYRSNGPAGIAALACGTDTVPQVVKIVGPGSPAILLAQMEVQRFGTVVEVGFGPTDAMIVADSSADPRLLAADLINEAEHGTDSSAVLVCTDRPPLEAARREVAGQLAALSEPRRSYATQSIAANGGLVLAYDREEAMEIANAYAPEHLQLAVADPQEWLPLVRHAGTTLLSQWTTFASSNFATGTPATLPTGGFATVSSGVTAHSYLTRTAIAQLDEQEFERLAPTITAFADHEGFPAHAATVTIRTAIA